MREYHLCRVAGNAVWCHVASEFLHRWSWLHTAICCLLYGTCNVAVLWTVCSGNVTSAGNAVWCHMAGEFLQRWGLLHTAIIAVCFTVLAVLQCYEQSCSGISCMKLMACDGVFSCSWDGPDPAGIRRRSLLFWQLGQRWEHSHLPTGRLQVCTWVFTICDLPVALKLCRVRTPPAHIALPVRWCT